MNNLPIHAYICTKDRYPVLLTSLHSLALQTYPPQEITIIDDGECKDLRNDEQFRHLFQLLDRRNIKWGVSFSNKTGQVRNHHAMISLSSCEYVFRQDDDVVLEGDTLARLYQEIKNPNVGAVAPVILHPDHSFSQNVVSPYIKDILTKYAVQFSKFDGVKKVEHLYSSFLYRKSAAQHGYNLNLSNIGHREESLFTIEMFRKGWTLLAHGDAIAWHLKCSHGGIRSQKTPEPWQHDEAIFQQKLAEWGIKTTKYKIIYGDFGIGDSLNFKHIIPELKAKYHDHKIVLAMCYPQVFWDIKNDPQLEIVELQDGNILLQGDIMKHNVFKFCFENNWKGSLTDAFRKLHL